MCNQSYIIFKSKIGNILIVETKNKITNTYLTKKALRHSNNKLLNNAKSQINDYFNNKRKIFNIPLNPNGTQFQNKVWNALINIPYGSISTYLDIAKILNTSPRAVGKACGTNPILIFIPCHRIISVTNKLTGFSALGGIKTKKILLNHENLSFNKIIS